MAMNNEVELYMYDLSYGLAAGISWLLVGKQMNGVWHTSIVVFGKEFYFGREGILTESPGETDFGKPPDEIKKLGRTYKTVTDFYNYLDKLKFGKYGSNSYSLVNLNCNDFTNELSKFLVGQGIPEDILKLPKDIITGGCTRLAQGAAVYGTYKTVQALTSNNKETEKQETRKQENAGPSWLEIGSTFATIATAAAAFSSYMSEEKPKNRSSALEWRSNNFFDSDSD